MSTTTQKTCTCGNSACQVRIARNLVPFCQMPAPAPRAREGFGSYGEAVAARKPGQRIRRTGNFMDGGPRRFVLVGVTS